MYVTGSTLDKAKKIIQQGGNLKEAMNYLEQSGGAAAAAAAAAAHPEKLIRSDYSMAREIQACLVFGIVVTASDLEALPKQVVEDLWEECFPNARITGSRFAKQCIVYHKDYSYDVEAGELLTLKDLNTGPAPTAEFLSEVPFTTAPRTPHWILLCKEI